MRWVVLVGALIGLAGLPCRGRECDYLPVAEELEWKTEEPGIEYVKWTQPAKGNGKNRIPPAVVHILRVDLSRPDLTMRSLRPLGRSLRMEQIVEFFRDGGIDVRAAINGDYFSFVETEKDPLGLHVSGGQLLWFPAGTTSLVVDEENRLHMDRFRVSMTVTGGERSLAVHGANREAVKGETVLYSGYYRSKTLPQKQACAGVLLTREKLEPMVNGAVEVTVVGKFRPAGAASMDPLDFALVACGPGRETAKEWKEGDVLRVSTVVEGFKPLVYEAISGGPRILRGGSPVSEVSKEGFSMGQRFYIPARHPRSAVGISASGDTVYMLVGEGRMKRSDGLTAADTACIFKAIGASEAMLFDGGGSTALMGAGKFYNVPHDKRNRTARDLANALAVVRKKKVEKEKKQ